MNQDLVIKKLNSLIQLDIDAAMAYEQAIRRTTDSVIYDELHGFQTDHFGHINELSEAVQRLGGMPVEFSRDLKGFFIEGMTVVSGTIGTKGALMAMMGNELLTNRLYRSVLDNELPSAVQALVERNLKDETRHLQYIQRALRGEEGCALDETPEPPQRNGVLARPELPH